MPYDLFYSRCPEIAKRETRTITLLGKSQFGLPPGDYSFLEMYCDEPACDCRRVFFYVVSSRREDPEAVIAYGWESRKFYVRWMGDDDPLVTEQLCGPALNLGSPQSALAPAILDMFSHVLLKDSAFVERLKVHYKLFRDKIDGRHAATPSKKERRAMKQRA